MPDKDQIKIHSIKVDVSDDKEIKETSKKQNLFSYQSLIKIRKK